MGGGNAKQIMYRTKRNAMLAPANAKTMCEEVASQLNQMLQELTAKSWEADFDESQKKYMIGLLTVIGGWQPSLRTGQLVQVNINNNWSNATVVDEGLGKERMSVVLEDDDNLQVIRVNRADARAVQKYQVGLNGRFGESVNSELLQKAIIAVFG